MVTNARAELAAALAHARLRLSANRRVIIDLCDLRPDEAEAHKNSVLAHDQADLTRVMAEIRFFDTFTHTFCMLHSPASAGIIRLPQKNT